MSAKLKDKIATIVLYIVSALVILLLVSLIGYIVYNGRESLNLKFLLGEPKIGEAGGGIGPQLYNSLSLLVEIGRAHV